MYAVNINQISVSLIKFRYLGSSNFLRTLQETGMFPAIRSELSIDKTTRNSTLRVLCPPCWKKVHVSQCVIRGCPASRPIWDRSSLGPVRVLWVLGSGFYHMPCLPPICKGIANPDCLSWLTTSLNKTAYNLFMIYEDSFGLPIITHCVSYQ